MNQNLSEEKKDIKPERPELPSNRKTRRTGGGGFLFSSLLLVLNSIGLIILFLWFFNTSGNQQEAGQNFVERISILEERLAEGPIVFTPEEEFHNRVEERRKEVNDKSDS